MSDYFLGIVPPKGVRRELAEIQSRHRIKAPRTRAHITLHAPFAWRGGRRALSDAVQAVCDRAEPFTAGLEGTGSFGTRVVFVGVEPHAPFARLHEAVRRALGVARPGRKPFHPHLTIAKRFRTAAEFKRVLMVLKDTSFAAPLTVKELTLFTWTNGVRWEPTEAFLLGGGASADS